MPTNEEMSARYGVYWMDDDDTDKCRNCSDEFTLFRRRHHCRFCGMVFCGDCCNRKTGLHPKTDEQEIICESCISAWDRQEMLPCEKSGRVSKPIPSLGARNDKASQDPNPQGLERIASAPATHKADEHKPNTSALHNTAQQTLQDAEKRKNQIEDTNDVALELCHSVNGLQASTAALAARSRTVTSQESCCSKCCCVVS